MATKGDVLAVAHNGLVVVCVQALIATPDEVDAIAEALKREATAARAQIVVTGRLPPPSLIQQ